MPSLLEALVAHICAIDQGKSNVSFRIRTPSRAKELSATADVFDVFVADWGDKEQLVTVRRNGKVLPNRFLYRSVVDQWIHAIAWRIAERNNLPAGCIHGASAPNINRIVVDSDDVAPKSVETNLRFCADPTPRFVPQNLEGTFVDVIDNAFCAVLDAGAKRFDDLGGALADAEIAYSSRGSISTVGKQVPLLDEVLGSICRYADREMEPGNFYRYVAIRRSWNQQAMHKMVLTGFETDVDEKELLEIVSEFLFGRAVNVRELKLSVGRSNAGRLKVEIKSKDLGALELIKAFDDDTPWKNCNLVNALN
jgi:hypothetical protein